MPDYKSMYFKLFIAHCDVIDRLQMAGLEVEKMAMDAKDPIALPDDGILPEEESDKEFDK